MKIFIYYFIYYSSFQHQRLISFMERMGYPFDKIRPVVKADFLFRHVHHHMEIQRPILEYISRMKSGNIHQTVQVNHHGLRATQFSDHAYPGISLPHGIFLHIRPIGIQQLADAQPPDEFLRLFPHHAALFRQRLQQFQSFSAGCRGPSGGGPLQGPPDGAARGNNFLRPPKFPGHRKPPSEG